MPSSTVITTAFLGHAKAAAKHLHIADLPIVVAPHPLYDLEPAELRELAKFAYPMIIEQITTQGRFVSIKRVDYERPAGRNLGQNKTEPTGAAV